MWEISCCHIFPSSLHRTLNVEKALSFFEIPKLFLCYFPTNGHCFFCSIAKWNISKLNFALKKLDWLFPSEAQIKHCKKNLFRRMNIHHISFFSSSRVLTQKFLSSEQDDRQEREHEGRSKTSNNVPCCSVGSGQGLCAFTWKKQPVWPDRSFKTHPKHQKLFLLLLAMSNLHRTPDSPSSLLGHSAEEPTTVTSCKITSI